MGLDGCFLRRQSTRRCDAVAELSACVENVVVGVSGYFYLNWLYYLVAIPTMLVAMTLTVIFAFRPPKATREALSG
jgi:hypothetical protein